MAKTSRKSSDLSELGARTAGVASSVMLSNILTIIIAGGSFVVVSRYLGPAVYGAYALAFAVAGTLAAVGSMGISNSFSKFVSQYKAEQRADKISEVLSSGYAVTLMIGGLLTIISILLAGVISGIIFKSASNTLLVEVASLSIILSMLLSISTYALIGFGRKTQIVGVTALQVSVQATLSVGLALAHFGAFAPTIGVISGFLAGTLLALMEIARTEKVTLSLPKISEIRTLMSFSLPLGVYTAVTGVVANAANLILGAFAGTSVVGNVNVAQRLGNLINTANSSVGASLVPLFSTASSSGTKNQLAKLYNYSVYIMFIFFSPVAIYMAVFSKQVSYLVFGVGYQTAPYFISIVSVGLLLLLISDYTTSLFVGKGKVRSLMNYGIIVSVVELILLAILVPYYKGFGMTFTVSLIVPLLTILIYYSMLPKILGIRLRPGRLGQVLVAALIGVGISLPLLLVFPALALWKTIALVVASGAVLIVAYPPILGLMGAVKKDDLEIIKKVSNGIPIAGLMIRLIARYSEIFAKG